MIGPTPRPPDRQAVANWTLAQLHEMVLAMRAAQDMAWWQLRELVDEDLRFAETLCEMGKLWDLAATLSWVSLGLTQLGRLGEADKVDGEAEREGTRSGENVSVWISRRGVAMNEVMRGGDLDAFSRRGRELLDWGIDLGIPWMYASYGWVGLAEAGVP